MHMDEDSIEVLFCSNDYYAMQTGVAIISLLEHHRTPEIIRVTIVDDNISAENVHKLKSSLDAYSVEYRFIEAAPFIDELKLLGMKSYFGSYANCLQIFVGRYYPNFSGRVIYLDSDIIVVGDIVDLMTVEVKDACGQALDCINHKYLPTINLSPDSPYYNDGVTIFELAKWRERNCEERILAHMRTKKADYVMVEQDLYNVVLKDGISTIPIKYNCISSWLLYPFKYYKKIYGIGNDLLSENELMEARTSPLIYHFAGNMLGRPWRRGSVHPARRDWEQTLYNSEWGCDGIKEEKTPILYSIYNTLYAILPNTIFAGLSYILHSIYMRRQYHV